MLAKYKAMIGIVSNATMYQLHPQNTINKQTLRPFSRKASHILLPLGSARHPIEA